MEKKIENKKSKNREFLEYVVVIALGMLVALVLKLFVVQLFLVQGQSMEPTFQSGDFAISSVITYKFEEPKIGDVVVIESDLLHKKLIKRVVGVEGDRIEIKDGYLYRNGKKIEEDYIKEKIEGNNEEITVPKGGVFVMGDNRNASTDGRYLGSLPKEKIVGKVVLELWNNPFTSY